MITVKCGYEGCDWKTTNAPISGYVPTEDILLIQYALHCFQDHNVPQSIWER